MVAAAPRLSVRDPLLWHTKLAPAQAQPPQSDRRQCGQGRRSAPNSGHGCPGWWSAVQATRAMTAGTKKAIAAAVPSGDRRAMGLAIGWSPPAMVGVRTRPAAGSGPAPATEPTGPGACRPRRARPACPPPRAAGDGGEAGGSDEADDQQCRLVRSTVGGCARTRPGSPPGRLPARRGRAPADRDHAADEQSAAEHHWVARHWPCERCCEVRVQHSHSRPGGFTSLFIRVVATMSSPNCRAVTCPPSSVGRAHPW